MALIKATEPVVPGERQGRASLAESIRLAVIKNTTVQWKPWRLPELVVIGIKMALLKNKKWLAYTVSLNDLIRNYEEILKRFEKSSIPLDDVFGSNTEQYAPHSFVLAFGSAVEPERLRDIVILLDDYGPDFLLLDEEGFPHKKFITIGSYNIDNIEAVPMSKDIKNKILNDKLNLSGLHLLYKQALKVPIIDNRRNR